MTFWNDVTVKIVRLAKRKGFRAIEHLECYTALGMATDQGKTSSVNAVALMAEPTGRSINETGTSLVSPPVQPVAIGAFAGHHRSHRPAAVSRWKDIATPLRSTSCASSSRSPNAST